MAPSSKGQAARAAPPTGARREAKSDAMRRRICEAAAACISENGFHRTTILTVVQRGRISIGALRHHYPSKDDLVAATAEYLLNRSVKWFARAKTDLAKGRNAYAAVIKRSWREQIQSADYGALLEIMVAARTDAGLRARLKPELEAWRNALDAELATLLPGKMDKRELEAVLAISRCLMTGLLVHDGLLDDPVRTNAVLNEWLLFVGLD